MRLAALPALAERPQELQPVTPRNHGGYRPKAPRPAPSCPEHGDDAPVIEETTVVKQHLCGTCETTLGEPVFTQKRAVIWDPDEDAVNTGPQVAVLKYGIHSSGKTLPSDGQVAARAVTTTVSLPLIESATAPGVRTRLIDADDPWFALQRELQTRTVTS